MKKLSAILLLSLLAFPLPASAEISEGGHRFGLNGGLVHISNPSQTSFSLSAEYEYRMTDFFGMGAQASHVFSNPSFTMIAAPTFFLHPLAGDWYISASPVIYLGSGTTLVGGRFMTRMPLDIGILNLTPVVGVDVIKGGPNYLFGLGVSI